MINKSGKNSEILLKNEAGTFRHGDENLFLNHDVQQHREDRNSSRKGTSLFRLQNHNGEVVDRRWLCIHKVMFIVALNRMMCACRLNVRISSLGKGFYDWKHALERLRNHKQSMEHMPRLHLFADINYLEELILSKPVRSSNAKQYHK